MADVTLTYRCVNNECPSYQHDLELGRSWEVACKWVLGVLELADGAQNTCPDCGKVGTPE